MTTQPPGRVYVAHCARCNAPITLPFEPQRAKLCDACYSPRPAEEIEHVLKRKFAQEMADGLADVIGCNDYTGADGAL